MPLLEKAFSKFIGNYERIIGGTGYESLRHLTGKPVFIYKHPDLLKKHPNSVESTLFNLYGKLAREGYPLVTSCCGISPGPDGLQSGHAFTLLDTVELQGTQLVKIRNPWSIEAYNGPWNDKDPVWTPQLLKQAGHELGNDGIFFMPFHNFISANYFEDTEVAMYKDFTKTQTFSIKQSTFRQKFII